ncbi:hypothetical protein PIB30_009097 [Stylosanthes scabra]|uniref:Uncharacterized protein n=1 Tax=Stylosanthes scabra TaxID=79078 RepID=A0ABU6W891_9FABA|nr:hypothetical protein [Stylosanthes scabra]
MKSNPTHSINVSGDIKQMLLDLGIEKGKETAMHGGGGGKAQQERAAAVDSILAARSILSVSVLSPNATLGWQGSRAMRQNSMNAGAPFVTAAPTTQVAQAPLRLPSSSPLQRSVRPPSQCKSKQPIISAPVSNPAIPPFSQIPTRPSNMLQRLQPLLI